MLNLLHCNFSNEKDKEVVKNILAAFLIKGGALLISFFSLPAYIRYFNNHEILGVWYTVLSVLTWILAFDLGIGNGLRNQLVGAIVRNDKTEIRQKISSAYLVIGFLVILVSTAGLLIFPYINWNSVFNIPESLVRPDSMLFVVACVFITIMLQFFLRLISFILYALQKSAINDLLMFITNTAQFIYVLLAPSYGIDTNIKNLAMVYLLCVNVPLLVTTVIVFWTKLKGCLPSLSFLNRRVAVGILQLGGIFFWNQIMYMVITGTNQIFITTFIGPGSVVNYQIYYKLFTVAGMLFMLALTPMWSAITKAFEERDFAWINKYFKLSSRLVLIVVIFEIIIALFLQVLVNFWLGQEAISVNNVNAIVFAIYGSVFIYQSVLSTFACGIGKLKLQALCYSLGVVAKFTFIYFGTQLYSNWIIVVVSDIIILLPYCILQLLALKMELSSTLYPKDAITAEA